MSGTSDMEPAELPRSGKAAGGLLLRGSFMQFAAFAANFLAAFFLMPFLIHSLGERGYGFWAIIGTIVGQLGMLDAGLMSTTQRFMAAALARDDGEEAKAIYSTSIAIFFGLGALVFAVICVIVLCVPWWLPNAAEAYDFQIALTISGLNFAMMFPFAVMQGTLAASLRADAASVATIINTVARTVLAFIIVGMGYGIIALALVTLTASLMQRTTMRLMLRKYVPSAVFDWSHVTKKTAKDLFAFGRFIFLLKFSDGARYRLHNLLIAPLAGIAAVTHYAVAARLVDYYEGMVQRLSVVTQPVYSRHFARGEEDHLRESYLAISRFGAVVCSVFATAAIAFGHPFLRLWLGKGFDDSYYALMILVIGMFFTVLHSPSRNVLRVTYNHAFDSYSNLAEVAVNLTLAITLIPVLGVVGAALGMAIPMVVVKGAVMPAYVCRKLGLSVWTYYRNVGKPILLAIVAGLPFALFGSEILPKHLASFMAAGMVFSALLTLLLLFALPKGDRASLIRAVGKNRIQRVPGGKVLLAYFLT